MGVLRNVLTGLPEALRSFRGARLALPVSSGLWRGKQFRAQYIIEAGASAVQYLRVNATEPFLLQYQALEVHIGDVTLEVFSDPVSSGPWASLGLVQSKYRIGVLPVSSLDIESGGSFTTGTLRETLRSRAGTEQGSRQAVQALAQDGSIRGLPAGMYYFRITCVGACAGLYQLEWEDLAPSGA